MKKDRMKTQRMEEIKKESIRKQGGKEGQNDAMEVRHNE